jgi:hypothetical protein
MGLNFLTLTNGITLPTTQRDILAMIQKMGSHLIGIEKAI